MVVAGPEYQYPIQWNAGSTFLGDPKDAPPPLVVVAPDSATSPRLTAILQAGGRRLFRAVTLSRPLRWTLYAAGAAGMALLVSLVRTAPAGGSFGQHLLQLGVFVLLGVLTASAGAIVMGAVLMNQVAYYVAALARAGLPPWAVTLLGWQPWAIARAAAFCTLGVLMAEPLLFRVFPGARARMKTTGRGAYVVAAMSGILTDWFLKAILAPTWGRWLSHLLP